MSLTLQPATALLALLRSGEITVMELAEAHIAQIERLNPLLNAITDFNPERVRAEAQRLERLTARGPLHGLPLTIKSSISVAGMRCEAGSALLRGNVPAEDAEAVRRLRAAGALILGTTNCPEFLMAYESANTLHGATSNPWDLTRSAGGSSGGEAAAIAAGLSACGIGSASGGSVRPPAHCTGICALKPTAGRISARGHLPPCIGPFSTIGALGPMARSIAGLKLLFSVLAAPGGRGPTHNPVIDPYDATSAATPLNSRLLWHAHPDELRTAVIGCFEDDGLIPVTPETRAAVQAAAQALREAGFTVKPFRPSFLEPLRRLWWKLFVQCGAMLDEPAVQGREHELSPIFRDFLRTAQSLPPLSATELLTAWTELDALRSAALAELRGFAENPLLLCPVAAIPAFRHGEREWLVEGRIIHYLNETRFTQWFNVLAAPAVVLPAGRSPENLPIGVQLAGLPHTDEQTLAIAGILEQSFGFQPPPIAAGFDHTSM
jgi:amidase